MKDWKIAFISAILLAAFQMFRIVLNGFHSDFFYLTLMIISSVPLITALLLTVLLSMNKRISSFLSLVFSFLNLIFIAMFMSLFLFGKTAIIMIFIFEFIPSVLLIFSSFRSCQRLRNR